MDDLEKMVLATLVYYDVLDRPLTSWEVFRYAISSQDAKISYSQVLEVLENSRFLRSKISQLNGFYFLSNRQSIINTRIGRQKLADQKWKKTRRWLRFLQAIPYIRLVMVSGSLALNNTKKDSDLDLLIVTKASRIWTCRALATLFFQIIGQRRHHSLTKDRFCLNHYITDDSLEIPAHSLYNAQTYAHLVPVLDSDNMMGHFIEANQWIKKYLAFWPKNWQGSLKKIKRSYFLNSARSFREWILNNSFGDWLESYLQKIQESRIAKDPLTYKAGGRVVFNNRQLEFHPDSPEKDILRKYNQKIKGLGLKDLAQETDSGLSLFSSYVRNKT